MLSELHETSPCTELYDLGVDISVTKASISLVTMLMRLGVELKFDSVTTFQFQYDFYVISTKS